MSKENRRVITSSVVKCVCTRMCEHVEHWLKLIADYI